MKRIARRTLDIEEAVRTDAMLYGIGIICGGERVDPRDFYTQPEEPPMLDHPAVHAVRVEKRWLHGLVSPSMIQPSPVPDKVQAPLRTTPTLKPEQVERMLRVEIVDEALWDIARHHQGVFLAFRGMDANGGPHAGPAMIEGVAWYAVPYLPEPGWRVINPMRPVTS